jgi:two-component system sensor histidine kinase BaeS
VRTIIHEMRNQLAVAVANVEAFIDGKLQATPERLQGVLQVLSVLDDLIDELGPYIPLNASAPAARMGLSNSRMREIDICELIANEARAIEATALEKGLRYEVSRCQTKDPACACFIGDPARVAEVIQNVLLNAVRYTPPGGAVSVDCRRSCTDLVFSVRDTGAGIASEEQGMIFDAGFRGSASEGTIGSGLGLAVVKRFVEEQGGTVVVESDRGDGATFIVTLPGSVSGGDDPFLPRIV